MPAVPSASGCLLGVVLLSFSAAAAVGGSKRHSGRARYLCSVSHAQMLAELIGHDGDSEEKTKWISCS